LFWINPDLISSPFTVFIPDIIQVPVSNQTHCCDLSQTKLSKSNQACPKFEFYFESFSFSQIKSQWQWGSPRIRKRVSKFKILSPCSSRRIERLWRNSPCNHGKLLFLDCCERRKFKNFENLNFFRRRTHLGMHGKSI